jgi:hypothetical protein
VPKLNPCQRAMFVNRVGHHGVRTGVIVVPQGSVGQRRIVRGWMHGHIARANHTPAPFSLHAAKRRAHARHAVGHAAGVRYTIKAIGRRDGTDFYRLEQHIKALQTRHLLMVPRYGFFPGLGSDDDAVFQQGSGVFVKKYVCITGDIEVAAPG